MSRLSIETPDRAQMVLRGLTRDMERRINASQPGLCPVDMSLNFLRLCHAQTCGKCVPCRVGLSQLAVLIERVLDRTASLEDIDLIENTAQVIADSADCAIGYEAAHMVLKGVRGFREDYEEHILHGRCICGLSHPVPCVSTCPAHVDIPGYVALIHAGRYEDAVRLIRKDNPFVSACAYVCEHPCEGQCRRRMVDPAPAYRSLADHTSSVPGVDNVFAGGDAVSGPATVIRAVAAGKVAAANIDNYLGFDHKISCDVDIPPSHFTNTPPCGRVNLKSHAHPGCQGDFSLVVDGMTQEEAHQESSRCLRCDHFGYGSFKGGRNTEW